MAMVSKKSGMGSGKKSGNGDGSLKKTLSDERKKSGAKAFAKKYGLTKKGTKKD